VFAPACSSALRGSMSSTCSNMSAAMIATVFPCSFLSATRILLWSFIWDLPQPYCSKPGMSPLSGDGGCALLVDYGVRHGREPPPHPCPLLLAPRALGAARVEGASPRAHAALPRAAAPRARSARADGRRPRLPGWAAPLPRGRAGPRVLRDPGGRGRDHEGRGSRPD